MKHVCDTMGMEMVPSCLCHTLVMPTLQMSWEPVTAGAGCIQAACERLFHLQKPNPSVKRAKDYALLIRSSRHFYYQNTSVEPPTL